MQASLQTPWVEHRCLVGFPLLVLADLPGVSIMGKHGISAKAKDFGIHLFTYRHHLSNASPVTCLSLSTSGPSTSLRYPTSLSVTSNSRGADIWKIFSSTALS